MKEYPESNYFLRVWSICAAESPEMGDLLPDSYLIEVNHVVNMVFVPQLPLAPWPPPFPVDWDHWKDRDEAVWHLFATTKVTVAPTTERQPLIRTVIFEEYPEVAHTAFWLPEAEYKALLAEVERAYYLPDTFLRLRDLPPGRLVEFLERELPKAQLGAYERKILCLDEAPRTDPPPS